MIELLLLAAAVIFLRQQLGEGSVAATATPAPVVATRASAQVTQLVTYADRLYGEKKWHAAEKAYLKVLSLDHKNVPAYSHLGIIYSAQKSMADAIECFEIAVRLKPSANTYQNLALAYYENRNNIKAIAAFEKAIMFEPSAARYIGLSKASKRVGNVTKLITALEKAAELEPTKRILQLLADGYEQENRKAESLEVYRRIHELDPNDAEVARVVGIHLPERPTNA